MNAVADFLSRLESKPIEKIILEIGEDFRTQPMEVKIEWTGKAQEDHVFLSHRFAELSSQEQLWQRKFKKTQY